MQSLPDRTQLSAAEKDDLIRSLSERVEELTAKVAELEGRLALNSQNSSKPPSSDGYGKPKLKSLRGVGKNPTGGQKGHRGHTLERSEHPDHSVPHAPPVSCECGKSHRGECPEDVKAPVHYGPRVKAAGVHLSQHHRLPAHRTADVMGDLCDLPLSDATVLAAVSEARERLEPTVALIAEAVGASPVVHADETGRRVAGTLHWLHVLATNLLTWMSIHPKRGKQAFDAFGLLAAFVGTLVHDGWTPSRDLACTHALCNAHHLRELTSLFEEMGHAWAKRLIEMLVEAAHEVSASNGLLAIDRIASFRALYWAIIADGEAANPRAPPSGKRGRTRQSKAVNLLQRVRDSADDVPRFMTDDGGPFPNHLAEQAVRMPKVKQNVSGCFRTLLGAKSFCSIRSSLDTLRKQGTNPFLAFVQTFQGNVPQPRLD